MKKGVKHEIHIKLKSYKLKIFKRVGCLLVFNHLLPFHLIYETKMIHLLENIKHSHLEFEKNEISVIHNVNAFFRLYMSLMRAVGVGLGAQVADPTRPDPLY